MTPEKKLQQELINLLIKLRKQATRQEHEILDQNIDLLATKATVPNDDFIEVCYYLMLVIGHCPNLMTPANIALFTQFEQSIQLKSKLEKYKKNKPKA